MKASVEQTNEIPVVPATATDRRVFLIGMMGVGKTTVGRLLAKQAGLDFVDCDHELEQRAGATIATMFDVEGEQSFRQRESALLDELTSRPDVVLATGGGVILNPLHREWLRARGLVVQLYASVEEILRRTENDHGRPLLRAPDRRARLEQLFSERRALYDETAHLCVHSGAINPRKVVDRLLGDPRVRARLGP